MVRDDEEEATLLLRGGQLRDEEPFDLGQEQRAPSHSVYGRATSIPGSTYLISVWRNVSSLGFRASFAIALRAVLVFATPSFLQGRIFENRGHQTTKPLHPTAYLDGMRGVASFLVYFSHLTMAMHPDCMHGYGYTGPIKLQDDLNFYSLFRLPVLRTLYNGEAMVAIFFIISGYALSYKPLKLIMKRDFLACYTTLASSTFRRAIRLYLPGLGSTLIMAFLAQAGVFELTRFVDARTDILHGVHEWHVKPKSNVFSEFYRWIHENYLYFQPFRFEGGHPHYDTHLWTIPVELHASLLLFVTLLGTAKMHSILRMGLLLVLMYLGMVKACWEMFLFYAGMLYAEIEQIRDASANNPQSAPNGITSDKYTIIPSSRRGLAIAHIALRILGVFTGVFFMSQPIEGDKTLFWTNLHLLVPRNFDPERHFYPCIGAAVLALTIMYTPLLKRFFESRPIQYLGHISFALYLMHNWVMHVFAYSSWALFTSILGTETQAAREIVWVLGCLVTTPALIWVSDMFWRGVDKPSMEFARWLENKCTIQVHS